MWRTLSLLEHHRRMAFQDEFLRAGKPVSEKKHAHIGFGLA